MRVIRSPLVIPAFHKGCAVALGNFDGLHLGHQAILDHSLAMAKRLGLPAALMTFEPHPREYFNPTAPKLRLMCLREKMARLREMGFSLLFMPRFNATFAATSANDFIANILVKNIAARHVITGENFCFGKDRSGSSALLAEKARALGFDYTAIGAVKQGDQIISSSAIRDALKLGDVQKALHYLGRNYSISGHVTHGNKRGRTLGFPTANIILDDIFIPKHGVYAVRATVDNKTYDAVANIGIRPTFGGSKPLLEAHLFHFNDSLYGKRLHVALYHFIRAEHTFASIDSMTAQLNRDIAEAKHLLST